MQISALLKAKGDEVVTIAPDASVVDLVRALADHGIGALVVSRDGKTIEGIVSERDVVRRMASGDGPVGDETVESIMSTEVATCEPQHQVEELMTVMTERRVRHVPVVENGQLAGIVSIGDVVKSRIGELERDRQELVEYITAR